MNPKRWTLQFMPEGSGAVRTVRISRRWVLASGIALVGLLLLSLGLFFRLGSQAVREAELVRLRAENRHLTRGLGEFESRVGTLTRAVDQLSTRDQRFRLLAGLPHIDPQVRAVGVGGPDPLGADQADFLSVAPALASRAGTINYDLDRLIRRSELLESSLSEAIDSVELRREIFLARPSIRPIQVDESWISSSFSRSRYHPLLLYNRPHEGIDISAHQGTPILATADGRVTIAGRRPGYGRLIEIDHGYGYRTRYAHAARILVRRGQRVRRGEQIGEVGQTGLASAPNLHYEVRVNGRAVNPRNYFLDDKIFE